MLVSLKYEFVLVAMPKCGSTALHAAFTQFAEIRMAGTPEIKHAPYTAYESYILPFIASQRRTPLVCEPFSLFRDPLDWLFSWYSYRGRSSLAAPDASRQKNYTGGISFSNFLNEHFKRKPASFARVGRQSSYIENNDGEFDAVTLFRYEDIDSLVQELENRVGKSVPLARKNVSPKRSMELTDEEIAEAKAMLKTEYQIYSAIPKIGASL
ncbi:MAG TPA: hypothetical protein VIJ62_08025 [Rhizomicrobium sp.]